MVKCLSQRPGLAGYTELCSVKPFLFLSHFSQISSCDETKHIISRPAILFVPCRSGVLKCFKHVKSFSLRFRASLISLHAFTSASIFVKVYDFIIQPYYVFTEKFIIPALSEASRAELQ